MEHLKEYCQKNEVVFVHDRGKRKSVHQRYLELFERFLDRQQFYDPHNSRIGIRSSYSKADVDATFMHMKDDYMRNAQLKPRYNIKIGVDSEYIITTDIFHDRNDVWTLAPFLKHMEGHLGFRYKSVAAVSDYESKKAYDYLESRQQEPYIKPQTYEKWKKRSFRKDISKRENMEYDAETDTFTCHAGKRLLALYSKRQKSKSSYGSNVTVYKCIDCSDTDKDTRAYPPGKATRQNPATWSMSLQRKMHKSKGE